MIFKPAVWYWIAVVLCVVNVAGGAFAAGQAESIHAAVHGVLALACGWWAYRVRQGPGGTSHEARLGAPEAPEALEALESQMHRLRQDLSETQERLDFAERMLAQKPDARRMGPQP